MIRAVVDAGLNGLHVEACDVIDQAFVRDAQERGLEIFAWTIDDPELARQMIQRGVDGITSNLAAWMRGQLAG